MYNLKRGKGTYKGLIGECLFKLTNEKVIITKFFNKNKFFYIFEKRLSLDEKNFLDKNWYSIDAIEIDYSQKPQKIILYEIKTLNDFYYEKLNGLNRIPLFTEYTSKMYKEAINNGFIVKIAIIWLKDNWDYVVELEDFSKANYQISKPRKYDRKEGL